MANMTFKASLLPNTNLGYSLGSDDKRWNIYGTLHGDAEKLKNIDGRRVNGSYMFGDGYLRYYLSSDSMTSGYPGVDGFILHGAWDWAGGFDAQLCIGNVGHCYIRSGRGGGDAETHTQNWTDWFTILDSDNYASITDTRYVTLSTEQTITAKKTFKETIIAYKNGVANNLPFITFDKPGSHYAGIGPDGTSNRIHFGPCDLQGTAWVASSTFNNNEWHFQGAITGTSTATISGGIISNHGHNLIVEGNEVNFIPDGYNNTLWFNYDSFNRTNNSTITRYLMGNGSHGHAELQASKVYGAVWNDYAEYREIKKDIAPGKCMREVGDGTLVPTTARLQRGCNIVSDTFGFAIGETERCKTPIAVSGRVLAYLYEDRELARQRIGYGVCSGPDGTVSIMTDEEERMYPNMIVGTISEVPDYEIWHAGSESNSTEIKVDGRVWVKVK